MTIGRAPICMFCRHFNSADDTALTCLAFPNGIPAKILNSVVDHRQPFQGDNGLHFEPKDAGAVEYAADIFATA